MKNLHLKITEKPSRLVLDTVNNNLFLTTTKSIPAGIMKFQNIFITNSEEIKEGDWAFAKNYKGCKKIILTTDQDLIKDSVQAIDDEFLEWFVKNPSCEEVEVEIETTSIQLPQQQLSENSYDLAFRWINKKVYKIIIPQEEPKQKKWDKLNKEIDDALEEEFGSEEPKQETPEEEAAAREFPLLNTGFLSDDEEDLHLLGHRKSFIKGAKYQAERMYSEEEAGELVYNVIGQYARHYGIMIDGAKINELFKEFKKKD